MLCTVMAWGATYQVGTYAQLKSALEAGDATLIELTADITYDGAWSTYAPTEIQGKKTVAIDHLNYATEEETNNALCIKNSLTLDGKGHKLIGWGKHNLSVSASDQNHRTTIAIHPESADAELDVTIKNLSLGNTTINKRYYGIVAFDGVKKLTLENDSVVCGNYSAQQPLCFTGTSETPIDLTIKDSYIFAGTGAYPAYILKPINATLKNSTFEGYCALYFKYRASSMYGAVVGSRGSVVNADACAFNAPNIHSGTTNAFGIFPMEDDGITLNLDNCSFNAQQIGDQAQMVISMQGVTRTSGFQPVRVNISGDNTHVYNVNLLTFALTGWNWDDDNHLTTYKPAVDAPLQLNISGGTFSINPEKIKFHTYKDNGASFDIDSARIATGYEVQEVKQGTKTLYRVVKKVEKDGSGDPLYNLNDNVETAGNGQNPITSFELSDGSDMTLNQQVTKAGYVQVLDDATEGATTVTVGKASGADKDQKLIINNGLDVQGDSKVEVKAGSTLVIGEGGITTQKPENIVIDANENGAASLIMDPTITVNQTPELTVKMTAKQIGRDSYGDYYWHRFAMPVQHIDTWTKEGALAPAVTYPTHLYGWSYDNNDWIKLAGGVSEMVAFKGYTLTLASEEISGHENELLDVTYVFKGNLAGNTNNALQFSHEGYNFFGNSYTGYISIAKLVEQITNDSKIQGTVWVWVGQGYEDISLNILAENPSFYAGLDEIAPMHTFVLKQNGTENASTTINYADAIWGNPRYGHGPAPAPRRRTNSENDAMMRVVVTAANGQKDAVRFVEGANYSDAFENGYDASKFMNAKSINVFATVNGEEFGTVATDNLSGKTITINTNSELAYTISFTNVNNEDYVLRDNVTGQVIAIEEGATYEFAAQPNSTIEGRFEIVNRAQMPTAIENTEVNANAKGIYTIMGQYMGEDFSILPAGVYVVNGVKIVK